jgi:hypothetical protein
MKEFLALSEDEAVKLLRARDAGALRHECDRTSQELHQEIEKLEREGVIAKGENILRRQREDPQFAARLDAIVKEVSDRESARRAETRAKAAQAMTAYYTKQKADAEFDRKVDEAAKRGIQEEDTALCAARARAVRDMVAFYDDLKKQGILREGEDLVKRAATDPDFRRREDEAAARAISWQTAREQAIRHRSITKLSAEVEYLQKTRDASLAPQP